MQFKPDFEATAQRFEAWWHGELLDRPPVTLDVRPQHEYSGPHKTHATLRECWLDVEFQVESAIAHMERSIFAGDTLPLFMPNIGPEITATLFGCELEFSEHSSWSQPTVHSSEGWRQILAQEANFDNEYWQAMEQMTQLALQECDGRYLVGLTDLHNSWDIMAALRDPQELCLDIYDCPNLLREVGLHLACGFTRAFERNYALIAPHQTSMTTWLPFHHRGKAYVPSCDFWCMVSEEAARQLILPAINEEMRTLERSIFHLDGPQALRHLDMLLELPQLNAIQWAYGDGSGPAMRWVNIYRHIQSAGRSFQVIAHDAVDALAVLDEIGPRGVWLTVGGEFEADQADDFLREVQLRSGGKNIPGTFGA
jgi:hypothetical protein